MNPELRRNFWLELTAHRLVGMPAVLALFFTFLVFLDSDNWRPALFSGAAGLFVVLVHVWGTRQASDAITDEVRDRTWDWQRLSAIGPWSMAWGKIAGATAFTWYGGALCVAAMLVASSGGAPPLHSLGILFTLVASGIALHGGTVAASLQAARRDPRLGHRVGTALLFVAIIAAASFYLFATRADGPGVAWYDVSYDRVSFVATSSLVFALWSLVAAYREMARELKVRQVPWAYPAFALFLGLYIAGFTPASMARDASIVASGLGVALAMTYYALFFDPTSSMELRRLVVRARAHEWRRALAELSLWPTALVLAVPFAAVAPWILVRPGSLGEMQTLALYPAAFVLAASRDAALFVFFALARRPRRAELVAALYIILLSWLIPGVLKLAGVASLAALFMPIGTFDGWAAALVFLVQSALVWAAVVARWRAREREIGAV